MKNFKNFKNSIFIRMALGLTTLSIIGLIVMFTVVRSTARDIIYDNVLGVVGTSQLLLAQELDDWLSDQMITIDILATTLRALSSEDDFTTIAERIAGRYDAIESIFIGFSDGSSINSRGWTPHAAWIVNQRPWYIAAREVPPGQIAVVDPYISFSTGEIVISMATHCASIRGVIRATIPLNYVFERISQQEVAAGGFFLLVNEEGKILTHPDPAFAPYICDLSSPPTIRFRYVNEIHLSGTHLLEQLYSGETLSQFSSTILGDSYIIASRIESVGWTLVSVVPVAVTQDPVSRNLNTVMAPLASLLVLLFFITMIFISYLIRNMEEKHSAEERLHHILDSIPLAISVRDKDNYFPYCNVEVENLFGLANKEEYQTRFLELCPEFQPDGTPSAVKVQEIVDLAHQEGYLCVDWMHKRLDGEDLPCEITFVRTNINNRDALVVTVRDLRNIQEAQKKENEANERVQLMFDSTPLFIQYWTTDYNLSDCNQNIVTKYSFKNKDDYFAYMKARRDEFVEVVTGKRENTDPIFMERATLWAQQLDIIFETGYSTFEYLETLPDGSDLYSEMVGIRITHNGETIAVTYGKDVTELRQTQTSMREAEENSRAKSSFLARMSHEIRTPIAAILGISEIKLQDASLAPQIEESFAKVHDSASILLSIVNDILDLSKIESGKMLLLPEAYDLASLVNDVSQFRIIYVEDKDIDVILSVDENLPAHFIGDSLRIKQIIANLLSNAFKYTQKGSVEIDLRFEKTAHNMGDLLFTIKDTGLGMSQEQLDFLHHEYTRFHEQQISSTGTGLGMSIVYSFAQMMDAKVDIESTPGEGTTVVVRIPQEIVGDDVIGREIATRLQNFEVNPRSGLKKFNFIPEHMPYGRVLVVDDIEVNLYVAHNLLNFYGLQIETCDSGHKAIQKIESGKVYDIIFMDHTMPGINGTETMQAIRSTGYSHPIIVLTANALIGQVDEFLEEGFDGFISKPININHLNTILNKHIRDKHVAVLQEDTAENASATGQDIDDFLSSPEMMRKIRVDFAKAQENTSVDIKNAIDAGDFKTAHRLAHSTKGLAALIKEPKLEEYAKVAEHKFKNKEVISITDFVEELERVLSTIPKEEEIDVAKVLDTEKTTEIFDKLQSLLVDINADALYLIDDLKTIPGTEELIKQIEIFEFSKALSLLTGLRME